MYTNIIYTLITTQSRHKSKGDSICYNEAANTCIPIAGLLSFIFLVKALMLLMFLVCEERDLTHYYAQQAGGIYVSVLFVCLSVYLTVRNVFSAAITNEPLYRSS